MKRVATVIFMTQSELDDRIRQREATLSQLPPDSPEHRIVMREIAKLRIYAEAERWLEWQRL